MPGEPRRLDLGDSDFKVPYKARIRVGGETYELKGMCDESYTDDELHMNIVRTLNSLIDNDDPCIECGKPLKDGEMCYTIGDKGKRAARYHEACYEKLRRPA